MIFPLSIAADFFQIVWEMNFIPVTNYIACEDSEITIGTNQLQYMAEHL